MPNKKLSVLLVFVTILCFPKLNKSDLLNIEEYEEDDYIQNMTDFKLENDSER